MAQSMTGFGRGEAATEDRKFVVEIRSVNHRYFDCNVRMPRQLMSLEDMVRKAVSAKLGRGKTDVFISYEETGERPRKAAADMELAFIYVKTAEQLCERFGLDSGLTAEALLRLPDVLKIEDDTPDEDEARSVLSQALSAALYGITAMRGREGVSMVADVSAKLARISALLSQVEERAPCVVDEYRARLDARLDELFGQGGRELPDANRVAAEIVLFADRCAVDEEIVRLKSHLAQMESCLASDGAIGRKLDFIVQEINREVNTIGSKANDAIMGAAVVDMKAEIEKIREQIQNIE